MHILIAQADEDHRRLLVETLQKAGHDVQAVADGQVAWETIQTTQNPPIAMLIADATLSVLDSDTLIRQIRQAASHTHIYTLLLVNQGERIELADSETRADDYLVKPVGERELRSRISMAQRILKLEHSLREARDLNHFLASHDNLTGLLNHRAIIEHARAEIFRTERMGKPVSLVLIDIDQFKAISEEHGYSVGEQLLQIASKAISNSTRPYDWVGLWKGEQVMLVLPATTLAEAGAIAERVRAGVATLSLTLPDGKSLPITASLGVSSTSRSSRTLPGLDELLEDANVALRRARYDGCNRVSLSIVHYDEG
jgi:diguanylate cyclase (GGDEF)-like protein